MKIFYFFLFLFIHPWLFAHQNNEFPLTKTQFNSIWRGDTASFNLINQTLKLNAPTNTNHATIFKSITDTANLQLDLTISLDFPPSTANRLQLFLTEDSLQKNGYCIEIGENGTNDAIHCYKILNGNKTLVASGIAGNVANSFQNLSLSFKLTDSLMLRSATNTKEFQVVRIDDFKFSYFSISCNYSATRRDKFTFDNLTIISLESTETVIPEYKEPKIHAVLITEIMIDPTPKRLLPEAECIELYNNSKDTINLKNWSLSNQKSSFIFTHLSLPPSQTVLVCNKKDTALFLPFGKVHPVNSLFTLSNTAFQLSLKSPSDTVIHQVTYAISKEYSPKKSGGWTYELQDHKQACLANSWLFSDSQTGGSLGFVRFIAHKEAKPEVYNYQIENDTITVTFNKKVKNETYYSTKQTYTSNAIRFQTCNSYTNDSVITISSTYGKGRLLFNEILFNPLTHCPEFVELYNTSNEFIKINDLYLGYTSSGNVADKIVPFPQYLIIPPYSFVVLSKDIAQLQQFYSVNPSCVLVEIDLPTLRNDEGVLFLLDAYGTILSQLDYNNELHHDFLEEEKGISLERTNEKTNQWTSGNNASVGYKNDAFTTKNQDEIQIESNENHYSFYHNQAIIYSIQLGDGNYFGDVILYTQEGKKVKEFYMDYHFSTQDQLVLTDFSDVAQLGIYLIYFEFRHPEKGIIKKRIPLVIIE